MFKNEKIINNISIQTLKFLKYSYNIIKHSKFIFINNGIYNNKVLIVIDSTQNKCILEYTLRINSVSLFSLIK